MDDQKMGFYVDLMRTNGVDTAKLNWRELKEIANAMKECAQIAVRNAAPYQNKRLSEIEVRQQKERFEYLLENTNLVKLGDKILNFMSNEKGSYNHHNFIRRVLRMYNVEIAMYHPDKMKFYGELLQFAAFTTKVDEPM